MTTNNKDTYLLLMSNEIGRHSEKYWENIHIIPIKTMNHNRDLATEKGHGLC